MSRLEEMKAGRITILKEYLGDGCIDYYILNERKHIIEVVDLAIIIVCFILILMQRQLSSRWNCLYFGGPVLIYPGFREQQYRVCTMYYFAAWTGWVFDIHTSLQVHNRPSYLILCTYTTLINNDHRRRQ